MQMDAMGGLVAVVAPLGMRTSYSYDRLKNRDVRTDALSLRGDATPSNSEAKTL